MKTVDYIIVGQGIAGSVLTHTLWEEGKSVFVFDLPEENMSSIVAAGLWNPIVLKRLKKVWQADPMIERVFQVYPRMEQVLGAKFFAPLPITRIFHNPGEQNVWMGQSAEAAFEEYLQGGIRDVEEPHSGDHGCADTLQTGRIKTGVMISGVRSRLMEQGLFKAVRVRPEDVAQDEDGNFVIGSAVKAKRVIWCTGAQEALRGEIMPTKSFSPVKGEVLGLRIDDAMPYPCVHQGHFMLEEEGGRATVGATYAWDNLEGGATAEKRNELEEHIQKVWKSGYEVVEHRVGVRPATRDRKPIIGAVPGVEGQFIFNGLGSRGVLMAPWLAELFVGYLLRGTDLPSEVDPARF